MIDPSAGSVPEPDRPSVDRRIVAVAAVIAVLPIVVAVVRALRRDWLPMGDDALVALRAQDVFSSHVPLVGLASSAGVAAGSPLNHPGPLLFDVLAVPVAVFGSAAGTAIGVGLLNAVAVGVVVWVAGRRLGTVGGVCGALVAATLAWSMGSELLYDPWQPHALLLPFLAFLFVVWALVAGDLGLLPLAVGIGSLLVQSHLTYVYLVPLLLVLGGASAIVRRGNRGRVGRVVLLALLVGAVAWSQPLVEQFTAHDGNLSRLVRAAGNQPAAVVGAEGAVRLTADVLVRPPFWLRDSFTRTFTPPGARIGTLAPTVGATGAPPLLGSAIGLAALVGALGAIGLWARRRRPATAAAVIVSLAGIAGSWFTASKVTTDVVGVAPHQFRFLWPVAAFVTFTLLVALGEATRGSWRIPARLPVAAAAVLLVGISVAALPYAAAASGPQLEEWSIPAERAIDRQLGAVAAEQPVLLEWSRLIFLEPFSAAIMAELRRRDIDMVTDDPIMVRQLGPDRKNGDPAAKVKIFYRRGDAARHRRLGPFRRIAFHEGLDARQRSRRRALEREIAGELRRDGLVPTKGLRAAQANGFYRQLRARFPDAAAVDAVLRTGVLADAFDAGLLDVAERWRDRFREYAALVRASERETVGVFVGPADVPAP